MSEVISHQAGLAQNLGSGTSLGKTLEKVLPLFETWLPGQLNRGTLCISQITEKCAKCSGKCMARSMCLMNVFIAAG